MNKTLSLKPSKDGFTVAQAKRLNGFIKKMPPRDAALYYGFVRLAELTDCRLTALENKPKASGLSQAARVQIIDALLSQFREQEKRITALEQFRFQLGFYTEQVREDLDEQEDRITALEQKSKKRRK